MTEGGSGVLLRAVIVDDEPAARDAVRTLLESVPQVEVVGEAADGGEAVTILRELRPDLLFLDIQMPDRDGFAVIEALGEEIPRCVILVTAHSEYAHRAFEVHAVDYIVKPFGRPRFVDAVERALHRLEADEALGMRETLRSLMNSLADESSNDGDRAAVSPARAGRIGVRTGNRTVLVDVGDIDWIEADGDLVRLHVQGQVHLVRGPLRALEANLSSGRFLRIHRSVVVNLDRVGALHRMRDGSGDVALRSGVRLRVSRGRWDDLVRGLELDWEA